MTYDEKEVSILFSKDHFKQYIWGKGLLARLIKLPSVSSREQMEQWLTSS